MNYHKKIKVLFVNTVKTRNNGITNVIFNLLDGMTDSNLEIGYVSKDIPENRYSQLLQKMGISSYILRRDIHRPISYIYNLYKIAKNYDIIHVHGNSGTMLLEMLAAKLAKINLRVAHGHNSSCEHDMIDKISRPLFHSLCNGRMACGKEAGEWLYQKRPFYIINNGIDTQKFRFDKDNRNSTRQALGLSEKDFFIGHVGNFMKVKNHKFLIEVFLNILKIKNNARLILIGSGELLVEVRSQISDLAINDKVIFTGSIPNPQYYLSAMDLIIMPSIYEGFPLSLVEEQANGLPCLVSDTISIHTNISGNITFKSLDDSAEKWAKEAYRILEYHKNSDRSRLSETSITAIKANGYDSHHSAKELIDLYFKLLNKN